MPVLVLFLCLIGNYYTYHSKGDLVKVEQDIYSDGYFISDPVPNSGYLENIYLNTKLSVDEVVDLFSKLTFDDGGYGICLNEDETFMLVVLREGNITAIGNFLTNEYFFLSSDELGLGFVGWKPDFNGIIEVNSNVVSVGSGGQSFGLQNDLISSLVSSIPFKYVDSELIRTEINYLTFGEYIGEEKVNLSFFDITLLQTDNTFIKFQLPFLRNAFGSVFNILEFESSYVSSFVLTSFTWLIQLLLLHVVVDTLSFIFKMYHKLMDKVV